MRRPSFCKTNTSIQITKPPPTYVPRHSGASWNPNQADPSRGSLGGRPNNFIDRKSLYSIKRENIASRDLQFTTRPPSVKGEGQNVNIEHFVERQYITGSRLKDATKEKFPGVIMKHFYKDSTPQQDPGYGMPRPQTKEDNPYKLMLDDLKRQPSIVKVESFPTLQTPVSCDRVAEYCEILGPSSCSKCIEKTNRHIGEELQNIMFPLTELTTRRLILPRLAKAMLGGHHLQVKKRRMHELGLDISHDLLMLRRKETPLSASTYIRSTGSHNATGILFVHSARRQRKRRNKNDQSTDSIVMKREVERKKC